MTAAMQFMDPPREGKWAPLAAMLRIRPGEWGTPEFTVRFPRGVADHINKGEYAAFRPPGAFEARTVRNRIYIRFVGENYRKPH